MATTVAGLRPSF